MAGHASPPTTVRYDRRGDEARREVAEHLHFPYTRPLRGAHRELACLMSSVGRYCTSEQRP